jgi:hypothetical protein
MDLTCPRCETEVPSEALYCPYCSLPKPKSGFAAVEANPADTRRTEKLNPPVGLRSNNKDRSSNIEPKRSSSRPITIKPQRTPKARRLVPVVSITALVALVSAGIYIFVLPLVNSQQAEPKVVLSALDKLKGMPSSVDGLTIDARLKRELETARRVKNLVSYQGWTAQPIKGTKTKVLLVFSYQEVGDVNKRAEWIADLVDNTFVPQTELASFVSAKG